MKSKLSIFIIISILVLSLCGCSQTEETVITYTPNSETQQADTFFDTNNIDELKKLCAVMSINSESPEARDNFFNYMIVKLDDIIENKKEDKYEMSMTILGTCLKLPLAQNIVVNTMEQQYHTLDDILTEKTKEYLIGTWKTGTDEASQYTIEVKNSESGLVSYITSVPENSKFSIGDTKWTGIHFANHKKFFLSDLTIEKSSISSYDDIDNHVQVYSGATADISFDTNTIVISYEKGDANNGYNSVWEKVVPDFESDAQANN